MDKEQIYWNKFYNNNKDSVIICSDFCIFVLDWLKDKVDIACILECGYGNGRDSYKLSEKYIIHGVDSSGFIPDSKKNVKFSCDNFVTVDKKLYNLIYSRFSFHSISNEDHKIFLGTIKPDTIIAMEMRSKKGENDDVYHGKDHYRNYIDIEYLKKLLAEHNFEILFLEEGIDMAKYKNENPICIRVISKKLISNT